MKEVRIGRNLEKMHTFLGEVVQNGGCVCVANQYEVVGNMGDVCECFAQFPQRRFFSDLMKASQGSINQPLSSLDAAGSIHTSVRDRPFFSISAVSIYQYKAVSL